jgi:ubiquinone biosynthesis monooxygenase Coq6
VWDALGNGSISFNSSLMHTDSMGLIVENINLLEACIKQMKSLDIEVFNQTSVKEITRNDHNYPIVSLSNDCTIETKLLIGADGNRSKVRDFAGIQSHGWDYSQMGIVANLEIDFVDNETAYQRFLPTGPVALLPLGKMQSSLVWSVPKQLASKLLSVDDALFTSLLNAALRNPAIDLDFLFSQISKVDSTVDLKEEILWGQERSFDSSVVLPPLVLKASQRAAFPLQMKNAEYYATSRVALVGDSAHTIHPLAGQGLNMGLADVEKLAEIIRFAVETGQDIGSDLVLSEYAKNRLPANVGMLMSVDALKMVFENRWLSNLRAIGMNTLDKSSLLKSWIMNVVK